MSTEAVSEFESLFLGHLGGLLATLGFRYRQAYSRPRGVALEFTRDESFMFASYEGGVVVIDLILKGGLDRFLRVSVNQALWYSGAREVSKNRGLVEILDLFRVEMPRCCRALFQGELSAIDPRFCFPLGANDLATYLASQRGARAGG